MCAMDKVRDISRDCDGVSQSPPLSGYMCQFNTSVYLIQDNGRMCLQSNLWTPQNHWVPIQNPWIDSRTFLASDYGTPPHLWRLTLNNGGNYSEYVPGTGHPADKFSATDVTANAPPISDQIQAAGGPVAKALSTGLFP